MKRHFRRWQIFHHRCVRQKWTHLDRLIGWSVTILWTRLVCIVLYLYLCLCLVVYCVCFKCHNKPQTYTVQIRLFTFFHLFHLSHSSPTLLHSHSLVFTLNSLSLHSRADDIRKKKDAGDLYKELLQRRILHGWFSVVKARGKHMRMARRSIQVKSLLTSIINQLGKMWMVRRSIQVKRRHYTYTFSVECSDSYMCFTTLRNEQFHRINRLRPDTATTTLSH